MKAYLVLEGPDKSNVLGVFTNTAALAVFFSNYFECGILLASPDVVGEITETAAIEGYFISIQEVRVNPENVE